MVTKDPGTSTAYAVSPDSGDHWTAEGAWLVAPGVHRIPLPLPTDGLRAVNVYVLEGDDGLTLVDGGWAIPEAREVLDRSLRSIGSGFGDIRQFLVTHSHRDHYTMASVLGHEQDAQVSLGIGDKPSLDLISGSLPTGESPFGAVLRSAGATELAEAWVAFDREPADPLHWRTPDVWLESDHPIPVGTRVLDAVATPGHTPGHFVFADRPGGLLFAGDHVLPTITPSIGFTVPPVPEPLGDFMASLTKVRGLPDLQVLPAHGPVGWSSHTRVDQLLAFHQERLDATLAAVAAGARTAHDAAQQLGWTRHERAFDTLDVFNQAMATMETKAHLELLVVRGLLTRTDLPDGIVFALASA